MGQYTNKGLYNRYDKNHRERDRLDYYATPSAEVLNILDTLKIDFSNSTILEPCVGGGHMAEGILQYLKNSNAFGYSLKATDIQDRKYRSEAWDISTGKDYDFFSDDYPYNEADWIIMNPPYSVIEPFTIRALEIANKGIIMLARLQFLEGQGRYDNILKDNPPSDVYVYVDRVQCWKDGVEPEGSSAQAYAWFVWDKKATNQEPHLHFIRRA
jgi:hypothetical protein